MKYFIFFLHFLKKKNSHENDEILGKLILFFGLIRMFLCYVLNDLSLLKLNKKYKNRKRN